MRKESLIVWGIAIIVLAIVIFGIFKMAGTNPNDLTLTEPVSASDHARGTSSAKAVLVEYGDYECPACYQYEPLVENLLKDESGKVNVIFRNFPLPQHANALPAAYAAEAAGLEGKFWEMHDLLYQNQNTWAPSSSAGDFFNQYAQSLGLNLAQFQKDMASGQVKDRVSHDQTTGTSASINSTPTFFLNGHMITVTSYDQFKQLIESANSGS